MSNSTWRGHHDSQMGMGLGTKALIAAFLVFFPFQVQGQEINLKVADWSGGFPTRLNPGAMEKTEQYIQSMVFESLFELDFSNLSFVNVLASYVEEEPGSNGREWNIHLKENVRWGESQSHLSSEDVVFSINCEIAQEGVEWSRVGSIESAESVDPYWVKVRFNQSKTEKMVKAILSNIYVVRMDEFGDQCQVTSKTSSASLHPEGTNDYFIVGTGVGNIGGGGGASSLELRRMPNVPHHASVDRPQFPSIDFNFFPASPTAVSALTSQAAHFLTEVPPNAVSTLQNYPHIVEQEKLSLTRISLAINHADPILKQRAVREAFAHAINRVWILQVVYQLPEARARRMVMSGPFSPNEWPGDNDLVPRQYSPNKAKALLDGLPGTDRFNLKNKSWKLSYLQDGVDQSYLGAVGQIINSLKDLDMKVEHNPLSRHDFQKIVYGEEGSFDLLLLPWEQDLSQSTHAIRLLSSLSNGTMNFTRYANATMDSKLHNLTNAMSDLHRKGITEDIHRLAHEELPHIWLWEVESRFAHSVDIVVDLHPKNPFLWIERWTY